MTIPQVKTVRHAFDKTIQTHSRITQIRYTDRTGRDRIADHTHLAQFRYRDQNGNEFVIGPYSLAETPQVIAELNELPGMAWARLEQAKEALIVHTGRIRIAMPL